MFIRWSITGEFEISRIKKGDVLQGGQKGENDGDQSYS